MSVLVDYLSAGVLDQMLDRKKEKIFHSLRSESAQPACLRAQSEAVLLSVLCNVLPSVCHQRGGDFRNKPQSWSVT